MSDVKQETPADAAGKLPLPPTAYKQSAAHRRRSRSPRKSKKLRRPHRSRSRSRSRCKTRYKKEHNQQMRGIVTFYDQSRGYGFINDQYFFTHDSILFVQGHSRLFQKDATVCFTVHEQPRLKYHRAVSICDKNGQPFALPASSSLNPYILVQ